MSGDYDATKITATGPALTSGGQTGQRCVFAINGVPKRSIDDLTLKCDGPAKLDVMTSVDNIPDNTIEAFIYPLKPGDYKVTVRCKGRQISGSPFKIGVTGETISAAELLSKVIVEGAGLKHGKTNAFNEINVDCRSIKPEVGLLKVNIKGPTHSASTLNIRNNGDLTYNISYKPILQGVYTLTVKIGDENIPGSPFSIKVQDF